MARCTSVATGLLASLALALAPAVHAQSFEQQLNASDAEATDVFGWSLHVSGDVLAVGAILDDTACPTDPNCNSGSVYVYRRTGGVWNPEGKLIHSDTAFGDQFGHDVAVDGNRILVGAHFKGQGAAYTFVHNGSAWVQEQKLTGSLIGPTMFHFGHSVGLDGDVAVVGTMRDDHQGFETGSAFVFVRNAGVWTQVEKLTASDAASGDRFGRSSDLEGDFIAIGAHQHDGIGPDSGAAYVYERDDNNTPGNPLDDSWPEVAALVPSDAEAGMLFGRCVDFSGDVLIVGAEKGKKNGVATGAAYIFFRNGGNWIQVQKLTPSDGQLDDSFGVSVALEGDHALIGAVSSDPNGPQSGSVYVFTRTNSGFFETGKLLGPDTVAGDGVGAETGCALSGSTALISARFSNTVAPLGGGAYLFDIEEEIGTNYCDITPNSAGPGAVIQGEGTHSIIGNEFSLVCTGAVPNNVGLFFYGPTQINTPLGNGKLCIGNLTRLNPPVVTSPTGGAMYEVDFTSAPTGVPPNQITAGTTWNFQFWFRDIAGGGGQSNLSNGVAVSFIP